MAEGFEPGTPSSPMAVYRDVLPDPADVLPAAAAERLHALRDDTTTAHRQTIDFRSLKERRDELTSAKQRLDRLLAHRSEVDLSWRLTTCASLPLRPKWTS